MRFVSVDFDMQDADQQTRACEKLLAAVVACALRDLAAPGFGRTFRSAVASAKKQSPLATAGISPHAFTAARFLFDTSVTGVDAYLEWLDIDPDTWRKKLRNVIDDDTPLRVGGFEPEQRRNMRVNLKIYNRLSYLTDKEIDDHDDE